MSRAVQGASRCKVSIGVAPSLSLLCARFAIRGRVSFGPNWLLKHQSINHGLEQQELNVVVVLAFWQSPVLPIEATPLENPGREHGSASQMRTTSPSPPTL